MLLYVTTLLCSPAPHPICAVVSGIIYPRFAFPDPLCRRLELTVIPNESIPENLISRDILLSVVSVGCCTSH